MTQARELTGRVVALTAALVALLALLAGALAGRDEALGVLAGGALTVGNFLGLGAAARLAVRGDASRGGLRQTLWVGASALRIGAVGLGLALVTVLGWVGLGGLVVSLLALPLVVVAEGLRTARAA